MHHVHVLVVYLEAADKPALRVVQGVGGEVGGAQGTPALSTAAVILQCDMSCDVRMVTSDLDITETLHTHGPAQASVGAPHQAILSQHQLTFMNAMTIS